MGRDWDSWLAQLDWRAVDEGEYQALAPEERLRRIRHSSAHVMATALQELFPGTRFAIGPAVNEGYFYDVRPPEPITQADLEKLQEGMERVAGEKQRFEVASVPRADAVEYFGDQGQSYKLDILDRIGDETVTLYRNDGFIDLCAGPHVPHTGYCAHARVLNLSSAHWRREEVPSLTRLSGTAWADRDSLRKHLHFLEEVKARDHRVLGPQLDLFSFHPWAASALWHPRGLFVRNQLMGFWRELMQRYGYVEILNPLLYRRELFERSGHWDHFHEDMFIIPDSKGEPAFALKPMNCPDTMLFFQTRSRSYRELPLRVSEMQVLHRNEVAGALHGIMRTRNFSQDDAHIFLAPEHVQAEIASLLELLDLIYGLFEMSYDIRLSTRPEKFLGSIEVWNEAERGLKEALDASGRSYTIAEGDGAFYGPKIDVSLRDSLGRSWQCGTIQLDFQLPQRFDLKYSAADGTLQQPIVIHRAIFGSFERFMGVLIEHLGGAFPTWLAPVQAVVLPVSEKHLDYAREVLDRLKDAGIRVELVEESSLNYRIRNAEKQKIPYLLVVGEREAENRTVAVRQHKVKEQRALGLDELAGEIAAKTRDRVYDVVSTPVAPIREAPAASTEDRPY